MESITDIVVLCTEQFGSFQPRSETRDMKPVIGITMAPETIDTEYGPTTAIASQQTISMPFRKQQVVLPIMLSPRNEDIDQVLSMVDGLVFTGGADIAPNLYGDSEIDPATYGIND